MTEEEWHRFVWGGTPHILTVFELPRDIAKALGTASPLVRITHAYALKCALKHHLTPHEFPMLPITIEFGRCVLSRECLSFFYFEDVVFGKWFQVTLKRTADCAETWVRTFHIVRPYEVRRQTKKGTIVRPEKW